MAWHKREPDILVCMTFFLKTESFKLTKVALRRINHIGMYKNLSKGTMV